MKHLKLFGILFFTWLISFPAMADRLDDARKYRNQGKTKEAALAAAEGCMGSEGTKACVFLCALGVETSTSAWVNAGCASACTKGSANECSVLGSRKIMSGEATEGLKFLKMGCAMGDRLGCSHLKLLVK